VEEIAALTDATVDDVEGVLARIHNFDPTGVGARDLRECLLLQIADRLGEDSLAYRIVHDHF
jgi:RNA polymerase sigma-54 factor